MKARFLRNDNVANIIAKLPAALIYENIKYDMLNPPHGKAYAYVKIKNGDLFTIEVKKW